MQILNRVLYKLHIKKPPLRPFGDEISPSLKDAINSKGLSTENILCSFKSDMSSYDEYGEMCVFFDEKGVYCAAFNYPEEPKNRRHKKEDVLPVITEIKAFPIDEIDEIFLEKNLSSGALTYKHNGAYNTLCYFSLSKIAAAEKLQKNFNSYKIEGVLLNDEEEADSKCEKCGAPIPKGLKYCPNCADKKSTIIRLFSFFKGFKKQMAFVIFGILVSSLFNIIVPKFSTQMLYDDVLNPNNPLGYDALLRSLFIVVGTLALLKISSQIFGVIYSYIMAGILPKIIFSIKTKIFSAMQRLSLGFYSHKQTGSLMERVTRDSTNIYGFFVDGFPQLVGSFITLVGAVFMMLITSFKLTLILLLLSLVIVVLYPVVSKKFRSLHHKHWVQNSRISSLVSDNINGHRIIKAFSKEEAESESFNKLSSKLYEAEVNSANAQSTVFPILSAFVYFLGAVVIAIGGVMAVKGQGLTVGELLTFVVYLTMLQAPIDFLSWVVNWWAKCLDSSQRIFEIIDTEPQIKEPENPVEIKDFEGSVELKNIHFQYESAQPVIKGLSVKLQPGEALGIVGKTGAGKTTISNIIARLYDPNEGEVLLDGVNVKSLKTDFLRKNIGIVSQDIYLFMGTVMDNIRYAKPDATPEEVIAAAKAAAAHDFIVKLPEGYETKVGSGGCDLSGGERQRISIARTIIQNPKILILDEATASMDTKTERKIQESLKSLQKNRTTISIAHRLSTLRDADKLLVIDKGQCAECGSFKELMDKKGLYYNMFTLQQRALSFIGAGETEREAEKEDALYDESTKRTEN